MRRRQFLFFFNSLIFSRFLSARATEKQKLLDYWVWLHPDCSFSEADWQFHLQRLKAVGVTRILIQVYTGDRAYFKNDLITSTVCHSLETILPIARKLEMPIHAWMWTLINPSPLLKKQHPDWYVVNRLGQSSVEKPAYVGYYNWLCPTKKEVQSYLLKVVETLLQYDLLTGIHFDYIRFPDVILPPGIQPKYGLHQVEEEAKYDYCYCSDCREAFKRQSGIDPLEIKNPAKSRSWRQFRQNQITNFVKRLAKRVKQDGKTTSAAVFATPELARKFVRQDWVNWPLDFLFPMIYHEFYNQPLSWLFSATQQGVQQVNAKQKIISGLFLSHIGPGQLPKAIRLSQQAGASGVSFFSYANLIQNDEYFNVLQKLNKKP